jgi:hypothetical protein
MPAAPRVASLLQLALLLTEQPLPLQQQQHTPPHDAALGVLLDTQQQQQHPARNNRGASLPNHAASTFPLSDPTAPQPAVPRASSVARREQEGLGVRGPATVHPSRLALLAHQLGAGPFAQALSEESICGHLAVPGAVVEEEHEEAKVSREAWASGGGRG